ncbi:MAG: SCO family protein [Planctomycetota bacterium]|nr:SCO family protein [Planctomycetota bacterium]
MTERRSISGLASAGALLSVMVWAYSGQSAVGQSTVSDPPEGVGIDERLNERLPLDLQFTDDSGRAVTLGEYFDRGMPVILTPVFYRCQMLCTATLTGLAEALDEIEWSAGEEFQIVTFTIDPDEAHQLAQVKKRNYLTLYDRATAAGGWHFLTGDEASIAALTDAIGFRYRYVERTGQYAHAASIIVCTADGRVARYINTVMPRSKTLRKAIVEASAGTIGSPWDRILLWCSTYDPSAGKYVVAARKVMAIGGGLTVLLVLGGVGVLWRRELRTKRDKAMISGLQP